MSTENSITGQVNSVIVSQFESMLKTLGKAALNALFPNDFEYYLTAFELVDSDGVTREYFIFPINPQVMNDVEIPIKSINVTAGGVVTHKRNGFNPRDVVMSGTFGRKFKFLLAGELISFTGLSFTRGVSMELGSLKNKLFSESVKTGYGCTKILERILVKSNTLDEKGKPYALYLYNLASGNNYLVQSTNFQISMDGNSNMMWRYNISIKGVARAETLQRANQKSMIRSLAFNGGIQKEVNKVANGIANILVNGT